MAAAREQFAARRCAILAVSQAKPETLGHYLKRFAWAVPVVSDPELAVYTTFGLGRTRWRTFFNPRVVWGYLRKLFQGHRISIPNKGEDLLQLGGDFILTRSRRIVFAYLSTDPTDRPTVAELLTAIPSA